jgi:predicted metalloprotease
MRLGLGGILVLAVLSLIFKRNLFTLVAGGPRGDAVSAPAPDEEKLADFVTFVFNDTQTQWSKLLGARGERYEKAKLVLFRDETTSACGAAESAIGPFYCPADAKVYVDLGFYQELKTKLGAPGDFAQAYVIAHEVGHHVQSLLGIEAEMRKKQDRSPSRKNDLSVRLELQADCFAGVWAHSTEQRNLLERGDVEEGLGAAASVGDDRLQRMATGHVAPEKWTHGSSAMRVKWFKAGMEAGKIEACDTFAAAEL